MKSMKRIFLIAGNVRRTRMTSPPTDWRAFWLFNRSEQKRRSNNAPSLLAKYCEIAGKNTANSQPSAPADPPAAPPAPAVAAQRVVSHKKRAEKAWDTKYYENVCMKEARERERQTDWEGVREKSSASGHRTCARSLQKMLPQIKCYAAAASATATAAASAPRLCLCSTCAT